MALDLLIAVALGAFAFADAMTSHDFPNPGPATAVLMGGAGLALALRRLRPTAGYLLSMGLMTTAALTLGPYQAGSSLLIGIVASFSATAYGVNWRIFVAMTLAFTVIDNLGPLPDALFGMLFVGLLLGLVGAGGDMARRLRELSAANVALRQLVERESAATTRAAVEDERLRVARELHDILSHSLGVVALQTGAAEHAWESDPVSARESVHSARLTSMQAIEQLRTLLSVVRDEPEADRAPVPTLDDLRGLAAQTSSAGFRVDLEIVGTPRPVSPQVQASVYRVTQEGIANAMKHSGAHGCRIRLEFRPAAVVVGIDDDGVASSAASGSRLGLVGIRERAEVFGGSVDAGPRPSGGWRLEVAFPS